MKRTTIMLPDDVLLRLRQEAKMRGSSVAEIVRDAVERHLAEPETRPKRRLGFIGIAEGGAPDDSERVDELLADIYRRRADRRRAD